MKQKKLVFLIILLVLALTTLAYHYININKKMNSQPGFSYINSQRPSGGDTEGYAFPGAYKIKSQTWESDKLKIIVTASGNLCAQKQGSYAVSGDKITLTVREELASACNGIGFFDFTFLVGPLAKQDYKVFLTFGGGY